MGHARAKMEGGRLVGYLCQYDHTHLNFAEASACEPGAYAKAQTEKQKQDEAARRDRYAKDPRFDKMVNDIASRFAIPDPEVAEEVLYREGFDKIVAAFRQMDAINVKAAAKALGDRKAAEAKEKAAAEKAAKGDAKDK